MAIEFYKEFGENGYLANYSNYGFYKNNIFYKTVEHYYQSEKFDNNVIKEKIINSNTPKEASNIGRDRKNIRKNNFNSIKNQVMLDGVLEKFRQNKSILYKLIETRNEEIIENTVDEYYWGIGKDKSGKNHFGKILMKARHILKKELIEKLIDECKNREIYILGHPNPDADSIFSSLLLSRVLKGLGCKSHFCILNVGYAYSENDRKIILEHLKEKPEIISDIIDKRFILVDHNNLNSLPKNNVLAAIDHHIISTEIENVIEIEYASTGLLIYDLFKDYYSFSYEDKFIIGLTVLTDTDYLCSSRFSCEDKKLYDSLELNINSKEYQKNYFCTTRLFENMDDTIQNNLRKYNYNGKNISRLLISTYDKEYNDFFDKYCKLLDKKSGIWLLIWCNYEKQQTIVYFNKNILSLNFIITSTYVVLKELEKNKLF